MEDYLDEKALARPPGRKYAQSEASEKYRKSEASEAHREEAEDVDGTGKEVKSHPRSRTQVLHFTSSEDTAGILRDDKG
jgi:hypothetical protein